MRTPQTLRADWLLPAAGAAPIRNGAVRVEGARIAALGPADTLPADGPVTDLGAALLMPGLVNAHQHGRGVSQLLMGYPDLPLEPWMNGRRRHGPPDITAVTRAAAEGMLANGVTATLHANYPYGSGDYEAEIRAQIAAYRAAGLRATVCVGLQDRGALVYPDAEAQAFAASLPPEARALVTRPAAAPYAADWPSSVALMDRLQGSYPDDLTTLAWGPAGPQWLSDDLWRQVAADAASRGTGLHFHLLESPAQAAAARRLYPEGTLARLRRLGVFAARTSCAHGTQMTMADMEVAAAEGLTLVLNPGSNLRLFNGPPPVAALRAAGVRLALGTDNCALADDEDHLRELRLAALLSRTPLPDAVPLPARDTPHPDTPPARPRATAQHAARLAALPAEEATAFLAIATTGGAAAAFLPEGCGRLAPGAPADLTAFALDAVTGGLPVPPERLPELLLARARGADCRLTMVAGRIRYAARPEDHARLHRWQARAAASVMARTETAPAAALSELQAALAAHYAARAQD